MHQPALVHPSAEAREQSLLSPQTAGSLLHNIVHLYRRHFGLLVGCGVLPILAPMFLLQWFQFRGQEGWALAAMLIYLVAVFISSGAMTVAISDICVGNRPSASRAFGRITSDKRWWKIISASLMMSLGMLVGLLLLLVPGLWLMGRGFLAITVATLEGRGGVDAIKRSMALTQGQTWRTLGLAMLPILLAYIAAVLVVSALMIAAGAVLPDSEEVGLVVAMVLLGGMLMIFTPVMGITMVLLYYDQRVRREAYDVQALAEDLMR
jgi:hypothetical protein